MGFAEIKEQIEALFLLGYDKEQIIQMVKAAPALFKYTKEGIEYIFDSIKSSEEPVPAVGRCK